MLQRRSGSKGNSSSRRTAGVQISGGPPGHAWCAPCNQLKRSFELCREKQIGRALQQAHSAQHVLGDALVCEQGALVGEPVHKTFRSACVRGVLNTLLVGAHAEGYYSYRVSASSAENVFIKASPCLHQYLPRPCQVQQAHVKGHEHSRQSPYQARAGWPLPVPVWATTLQLWSLAVPVTRRSVCRSMLVAHLRLLRCPWWLLAAEC